MLSSLDVRPRRFHERHAARRFGLGGFRQPPHRRGLAAWVFFRAAAGADGGHVAGLAHGRRAEPEGHRLCHPGRAGLCVQVPLVASDGSLCRAVLGALAGAAARLAAAGATAAGGHARFDGLCRRARPRSGSGLAGAGACGRAARRGRRQRPCRAAAAAGRGRGVFLGLARHRDRRLSHRCAARRRAQRRGRRAGAGLPAGDDRLRRSGAVARHRCDRLARHLRPHGRADARAHPRHPVGAAPAAACQTAAHPARGGGRALARIFQPQGGLGLAAGHRVLQAGRRLRRGLVHHFSDSRRGFQPGGCGPDEQEHGAGRHHRRRAAGRGLAGAAGAVAGAVAVRRVAGRFQSGLLGAGDFAAKSGAHGSGDRRGKLHRRHGHGGVCRSAVGAVRRALFRHTVCAVVGAVGGGAGVCRPRYGLSGRCAGLAELLSFHRRRSRTGRGADLLAARHHRSPRRAKPGRVKRSQRPFQSAFSRG